MEDRQDILKIAVLGCGFMGTAVVQGLVRNLQNRFTITACVRSSESAERLKQDLAGLGSSRSTKFHIRQGHLAEAAEAADVIVLGCKAEDLDSMLRSDALVSHMDGKLIISLIGGLPPDRLATIFHERLFEACGQSGDFPVIQTIPTIGAKLGDSVTLTAGYEGLVKLHQRYVYSIFESIGSVKCISQTMMDDAVAVGAVTHALAIVAIDALADAGVAKGLPRATVSGLVAQNLRSAANLMDKGMSPESLKAAMSTPSGITLNSLLKLESGGARSAIQGAATFAIDYARQMTAEK